MRCWPNNQQVSSMYHSTFISRSLHIWNASLNQTLSTLQHIINLANDNLINTDANFLFKGNLLEIGWELNEIVIQFEIWGAYICIKDSRVCTNFICIIEKTNL